MESKVLRAVQRAQSKMLREYTFRECRPKAYASVMATASKQSIAWQVITIKEK